MRLGFDVRKLGDGGIGVYVRETLIALREKRPDLELVAFGAPGARTDLPLDRVEWIDAAAGKYGLAEHVTLPARVDRARVDLFHEPHYVLPLRLRTPSVVTVHDLIHVLLPRSPIHAPYARFMIRSACRRARRVITVSATTARDLTRELGVDPEKIRVVWNGLSPRIRPLPAGEVDPVLARLGLSRGYVLFVGNCLPHKNVETLVRAWGRLAAPRPELVICGKGYERSSAFAQARAEVGGGIRMVEKVEGDDLVALYNGAALFASTSLYEGFCLPVVEAFACGVPVLGPEAGAVPEIAGPAARLVPPRRVDLIADEMYRLLTDRGLRDGLVEKGFERAALFSWAAAADKTLAVYEEAIYR